MLKYLKYLIVIFATLVMIFVFYEPTKELEVLTFNHNTIQNIKNNEIIRVPMLINKENSYIANQEFIETISLKNDDYLIPVDLIDIKKEKYLVNYNNQDYYAFMFDLVFNQEGIQLKMPNTTMMIKYQDGNTKSYLIGNVSVTSDTLEKLNIFYLNSVNGELNNFYTVNKVIVGITNNSNDLCLINNFSIDLDNVYIDNSEIIVLDELPSLDKKDMFIYQNNDETELNYYLDANESKYFVLPLKYLKKEYLYRFYINVETNNNKGAIDDFLFLNQGYFPSFMFEQVNRYVG